MHVHWPLARAPVHLSRRSRSDTSSLYRSDSRHDDRPPSRFFPISRNHGEELEMNSMGAPNPRAEEERRRSRGSAPEPAKHHVFVQKTNTKDQQMRTKKSTSHQPYPPPSKPLSRPPLECRPLKLIYGLGRAAAILLAKQITCPSWAIRVKATSHKVADGKTQTESAQERAKGEEGGTEEVEGVYARRPVAFKQLYDPLSIPRQQKFCQSARTVFDLPVHPPTRRILDNESDASGAFLANVVYPAVEVINAFIAPEYAKVYEVQAFTEVHMRDDGTSYLDIVLMLINYQKHGAKEANITVQHPLLVIEMKRYHLVRLTDWTLPSLNNLHKIAESNTAKLLPQLLMYADKWDCARVYLSDYAGTIAFRVSPQAVRAHKAGTLKVGVALCEYVQYERYRTPRSVYDYGPRMAIAFDAVEELFSLGLVTKEDIGAEPPKHEPEKLRHVSR